MAKKASAKKAAVTKTSAKKPAAPKKAARKTTPKTATPKRATSKRANQPLTLSDIYNRVAARASKEGIRISAAETKRVLACFFDALEDYSAANAFDCVAKGLKRAGQRRR